MANRQILPALQHLCHVVCPASSAAVADAELLDRFLARRDEAAFELLVWRHGPMVLGVCGRMLERPADVEDAFQATFLMLLRKARQIGKRGSVGSWLYKVAYRIALRVRSRNDKRAGRERSLAALPFEPATWSQDEAVWRELRPILDAEVSRLPETYRAPFVLCCMQGKTNTEAARELGCPRGTVDSRLARARERLRDRLQRRGVCLAAWSLGTLVMSQSARLAEVSPVLVHGTVQAALLWSLKGLAGLAGASTPVANLVAAEIRGFWRRFALISGALAVLAVAGTGWSVYAHEARHAAAESQQGCPIHSAGQQPHVTEATVP